MLTKVNTHHMSRQHKLAVAQRQRVFPPRRPIEIIMETLPFNPFHPLNDEEMEEAIERIDRNVAEAKEGYAIE